MALTLHTRPAQQLTRAQHAAIIALCNCAYEEDLTELYATFEDATHVLGEDEGALVTHALWVTRHLQVADQPLLRTAYVELVATNPAYQRRGFAAAVMRHIIHAVPDYDLAALSPFRVDYYTRLGWELWRGPLFIRHARARQPSPPDEEVMIYRWPRTPPLDLTAPLSAEWRAGELW
jgi:aminoglycoside 2'-N-acetyltransferase I